MVRGRVVTNNPLMAMKPLPTPEPRVLFEQNDLRWTKQREEIFSALRASLAHPTADELYRLLNSESAADLSTTPAPATHISLATVYNSLEAFTRSGLCRRLTSPTATTEGVGAFRYDAEMADHTHLVSPDGRITDLPDDLNARILAHIPQELVREVESRLGITIDRLSVEFIQAK